MTPEQLKKLLARYGVQELVLRNANLMGLCPNHKESRPSWGMRTTPPFFHGCFSCGFKGTLESLLRWFGASPKKAALEAQVAERIGTLRSFRNYEKALPVMEDQLLYVFPEVEESFDALRYVKKRGISQVVAHKSELHFDPSMRRVLFPWHIGGKLRGLTGRAIDPEEKVKTLPYFGTEKSMLLYLPFGRITKGKPLVLVEGEIDALHCCVAGIRNVAALGFGSFTKAQADLVLKSAPSEVACFFDDDETGERLKKAVLKRLQDLVPLSVVGYPAGNGKQKMDPGALSLYHLRYHYERRKSYWPWSSFKL